MSRLVVTSPVEGLQVTIAALKSTVSDYALRARQAEEMVQTLMNDKIGPELLISVVVNKVNQHIDLRALERSTQLLGVIQTTLLALTAIKRGLDEKDTALDNELKEIIKALTLSANPS